MKRRLPSALAAMTLGGCSAPQVLDAGTDAGGSPGPDAGRDAGSDAGLDAGYDAGVGRDGGVGTPWGDAGCVLPSDFPWDAGPFVDFVAESACQCTSVPLIHCFEENGPRCLSWACPPSKDLSDGGYQYQPDGGLVCLC